MSSVANEGIDIVRIQLVLEPGRPIECQVSWRARDGTSRSGLGGAQTLPVPEHLIPFLRRLHERLDEAIQTVLEARLLQAARAIEEREQRALAPGDVSPLLGIPTRNEQAPHVRWGAAARAGLAAGQAASGSAAAAHLEAMTRIERVERLTAEGLVDADAATEAALALPDPARPAMDAARDEAIARAARGPETFAEAARQVYDAAARGPLLAYAEGGVITDPIPIGGDDGGPEAISPLPDPAVDIDADLAEADRKPRRRRPRPDDE